MTLCARSLLCVVAAVAFASGCARTGGEAFQPTLTQALGLDARVAVGQTFRPATTSVRGVDLAVATYGAPPDPAGVLEVELRDASTGRLLATSEVPASALGDGAWVTARFDPPPAAPEVAALEVTWSGATPVALWANAPTSAGQEDVGYGDPPANDPYPGGELLLAGERAAGDLAFRVRGSGGIAAAPRHLAALVRSAGGRLLDAPAFAAAWMVLLVASAVLAVRGWRGARG